MLPLHRFAVALFFLLLSCYCTRAQVANFSTSPKSGCAPLAVNFSNQSSGVVSALSWNLGNSVTANTSSPSTTYSTPGIYIVTLTVTGPGGSDTKTDTVTVFDGPTISFNASNLAGCSPHGTQFNATVTANAPGALHYSWAFGDGTTDTAANPFHIYQTPGTFTVSLTVTNGAGCSKTAVQNALITAWPKPVPSFSANQTYLCGTPATVTFSGSASSGQAAYTYRWDYGDNSSGSGAGSTHVYALGGTYDVTLHVTDSRGCRDSLQLPNYIFVQGTIPTFSAANVCEDSFARYSNTTGSGGVAAWDFGNGYLDTGNTINYAYAQPGTYTVTMTVLIGNCVKKVSRQIIIYPKSAAKITRIPAIPCPNTPSVTLTANSSVGIQSYDWLWPDNTRNTGQTIARNYQRPVEEVVKVTLTTVNGCVDEVTDSVLLRPIDQYLTMISGPDSMQELAGGCAPYTITFGKIGLTSPFPSEGEPDQKPYPAPIASWNWNFGDGGTSTSPYPRHTFVTRGRYLIRSIITTANGCIDTQEQYLVVDTPIRPSFRVTPDSVCYKGWATYINTTPNIPPGTRFSWILDREFTTVDTQSLRLRIYTENIASMLLYSNNNGCVDSFFGGTPLRVLPPYSRFRDSVYCWPDRRVKFTNISVGATSQLWLFGDSTTDTSNSPVHSYATSGAYAPRMVSYNAQTGCSDTGNTGVLTTGVRIRAPNIAFKASDTVVCADVQMSFTGRYSDTDTITGSSAYPSSYAWIIDSVSSPFSPNDTKLWSFSKSGFHDVTMIIAYGKHSCLDTLTKTQYVKVGKPEAHFSADVLIGCAPLQVSLRDSTVNPYGRPMQAWYWFYGDRDSLYTDQDTVRHLYRKPGIFDVKLIVIDSTGCRDTIVRKEYIHNHKTVAAFGNAGPDTVCTGTAVSFASVSTGFGALRHQWEFGDGTTDTARNPVHRYAANGNYPVRLIVTDTVGCSDTIRRVRPIHINIPDAKFRVSSGVSICPPLQVSFINSSTGGNSYAWDLGDGSPGPVVVTSPIVTYTKSGIFTVRLIVSDPAGCRDTAYDSVRVLGYAGAFSFNPPRGCLPMAVTFTPSVGGIPVLTWDFGDGSTDTSRNSASTTHTYTRAGAFFPKVIFADGLGCNSLSNALDSVYIDEVTADFSWSVPCADTPFTLSDKSSAVYGQPTSFRWSSPAATRSATGSPASLIIPTAGTHPITLIATNAAGCADTITKDVLINALPPVFAGLDTAVCPGDTARLFASGALGYTWAVSNRTPTAGLACPTCDTALGWIRENAVYTLSGVDANGCYGRDSVAVTIQLKTTSTTGPGGQICYGESYQLQAAGADVYQWSPAESLDNAEIASPLARPNTTTTYMVISQEGSCQVDTQRIRVAVNPLPNFSAGPDKTIVLGGAATLEPRGTFTRIEWLYSDTTLSCWDCKNPNAHPYYTRTYWAKATNEFGCESTDSVTVFVRCNGSQVFIPNTFTPNGDGQNDRFYPQGAGLDQMATFRVFNRWGELVFEALNVPLNSAGAGWDGTYKGQALAPDTYVYTMTSRCRTGEIVSFKGDVTLVR